MTEMYTMQTYLQKRTLEKLGIDYFDAWAADFGETVTALELAPSGKGYRARTRFASGMAMSLKSGLDMDESLTLAEKLVDYEPLRKQIAVCREDMKNGESFPKVLKESHIFGGMQERLMVIGYETGATDEVMEQSADLYQKELQDQIQKMIGILEPTLVGILCVIVGVILLSVMLPLAGIMAGIG